MLEGPFVARVRELGGFAGRAEAMRAIRATVMAIGERLRDDERAAFERNLPPSTFAALERVAYLGDFDRDELYARVARHEAVSPGFALEHAQIVCRALAEALPEGALVHLRKELGTTIASLLEVPEPIETLPRSASTAGSTLASGREGSRHPLSESRLDRAQSSSVARADDPHEATKLSTARGLTQERHDSTLASGHPGARRSLADTKD